MTIHSHDHSPAAVASGLIPRGLAVLVGLLAMGFGNLKAEDGFKPMFNGKDLSGWVRVNTDESTWSVKDGMLICSGKPVGEMRTERMYQNFILELEWRHMVPRGNAGVFIWADDITAPGQPFHRGIEVQILETAYGDNEAHTTHGDIFPIHGATMTPINGRGGNRAFPTEKRSLPSPEWNHYRIECNDGDISLAVNGAVVTRGENCRPSKGYLCLESEGGVVHYRNVRIKELPDTPVADEAVAIADRGYRCLYTGIDLDGWKTSGSGKWQPKDWVLSFLPSDGTDNSGEDAARLETEESFGDFGFIVDVRRPAESSRVGIHLGGSAVPTFVLASDDPQLGQHLSQPGRWDRLEGTLRSNSLTLTINGAPAIQDQKISGRPEQAPLAILPQGPVDFTNIYVRDVAK